MRLSPAAELAVRGVIVLAQHRGEGPLSLKAICEARGLPKQYLVKLFAMLAKADIVTAVRGKGGGFVMARDPADISILEIIEAVEGPVILNFCQHTPPRCRHEQCRLRAVWADLQQTFRRKLGAVSVADCVAAGPASPQPRRK